MHWKPIETLLGPQSYSGRYRVIGSRIEVEWGDAKRVDFMGAMREEIAAANVLRQLVRRTLGQSTPTNVERPAAPSPA